MKKYLMTGMAALAICAAFTSCSKDTDVYNSGVIDNNNKQSIVNNYNEAFVKTFGQPAANHQWGFVNYAKANTRDVDVNGNMWETRPELGETEEQDVLDYMDMTLAEMDEAGHIYSKLFPVNMPNFFVTQVHTGDDYYGSAQEPTNKNVLGSTHMNELVIAITESAARTNNTIASNTLPEADSWHHVNNFNAGSSKDWGGNTKFVNMGTCDFAYHNSKDSRFHNRWIVVSGADIDAALGVNKYAGYYYVCFDFQSQVPDGQTDKTYFSFNGLNDSGTMQSYNGEIEGFYQTAQDIIDAGITEIRGYDGKTRKIEDIADFTVTRYEHAHAIIPGDNNYSDWIIRLVAATPDGEGGGDGGDGGDDPEYTLRVICEDLNAQAQAGDTEDSDWDFNDLVFDVAFLGSDQVQIQVVAVGGTMPIRINGEDALEAHGLFNEATNIMINTGAEAKYPNQAATHTTLPTFTRTIAGVDAAFGRNIKVEVEKNGQWIELEAKAGQPAAKMGVMPDFNPCTERQDITSRYSNFVAWVNTQSPSRWWAE